MINDKARMRFCRLKRTSLLQPFDGIFADGLLVITTTSKGARIMHIMAVFRETYFVAVVDLGHHFSGTRRTNSRRRTGLGV